MVSALVAQLNGPFRVTDKMWTDVLSQSRRVQETLQLLLPHQPAGHVLSETVLLQLVDYGRGTLEVVFQHSSKNSKITLRLLKRLAQKGGALRWFHTDLLKSFGHHASFSEGAMAKLIESRIRTDPTSILSQMAHGISITERIIEAAAANRTDPTGLLKALLPKSRARVTQKALENAAVNPQPGTLSMLLGHWGKGSLIPHHVVTLGIQGKSLTEKDLSGVLDQSPPEQPLPEEWLTRAARDNPGIFAYLFHRFEDRIDITSWVVEAAASAKTPEVLSIIRRRRPKDLVVTARVISSVNNRSVLRWLFKFYGHMIPITGALLQRMIATRMRLGLLKDANREAPLSCALAECCFVTPIQDDILVQLASGEFSVSEVKAFISYASGDFKITRWLVYETSPLIVRHRLKFKTRLPLWTFLEQLRNDITIDEDALAAIAERHSEDYMAYVFSRLEASPLVTDKIVKAAARNEEYGEAVLAVLLDHFNKETAPATNRVVESVLGFLRFGQGEEQPCVDSGLGNWIAEYAIAEAVIRREVKSNWRSVAVAYFQHRYGARAANEAILRAFRQGEHIATLRSLLNKLPHSADLAEQIVVRALRTPDQALCDFIISEMTAGVVITGAIIEAAASTTATVPAPSTKPVIRSMSSKTITIKSERGAEFLKHYLIRIKHLHGSVEITQEAFARTARCLDVDMMRLLLSVSEDSVHDDNLLSILEAASENKVRGQRIARLLLSEVSSDRLTESILTLVAKAFSEDVMLSVLEKLGSSAPISRQAMDAASKNTHGTGTLRLLRQHQGGNELTSNATAKDFAESPAVAEDEDRGPESRKANGFFSETIEAALRDPRSEQILAFIIRHWDATGDDLPIVERVMKVTANAKLPARLTALLHHCQQGQLLTDDILFSHMTPDCYDEVDARHIASVLLDLRGKDAPITEECLKSIASIDLELQNHVLEQLVDRFGTLPVTEGVLEAAIASCSPQNFLALALDQQGAFPIADGVLLEAAVRGWGSHKDPELVLRRLGHIRSVPSRVVQAAAGCPEADTVLEYFYENFGQNIQVTEDVIIAAVRGPKPCRALRVLSSRWGREGQITEKVMIEAARLGNAHDAILKKDFLVLEAIRQGWGMGLLVTESVVEAAAGSRQGKGVLEFLVDKLGTVCGITEQAVKAAAANPGGKDILLLMTWRWGKDNIPITEAVLEAARGHLRGRDILALIAERWGSR